MSKLTETWIVCDGCGSKSDDKSNFNTGGECGSSTLKLKGSHGSMAYNGDWGGMSHNIESDLCFKCAQKVISFIGTLKLESKQ